MGAERFGTHHSKIILAFYPTGDASRLYLAQLDLGWLESCDRPDDGAAMRASLTPLPSSCSLCRSACVRHDSQLDGD